MLTTLLFISINFDIFLKNQNVDLFSGRDCPFIGKGHGHILPKDQFAKDLNLKGKSPSIFMKPRKIYLKV